MILEIKNINLKFERASLTVIERGIDSVFKTKNNKTLKETLQQQRYKSVSKKISKPSDTDLDKQLGIFLMDKKLSNDVEYKLFLNKYGDNTFCHFKLDSHCTDKGLYAWVVDGEIKYIGRCTDNFKKRVNQGYGKISAKNCFIDGQATNCHLNSEVNKLNNIEFYVLPMNERSTEEISELELKILKLMKFDWNIQNNKKHLLTKAKFQGTLTSNSKV